MATTLLPGIPAPAVSRTRWGQWRSEARVELLSTDGIDVEMLEPLIFVDRDGTVHVVKVGFRSNGASVPRWLWSVVGGPLSGRYRRASLLHDWLYDLIRRGLIAMSYWTADRLFEEAMRADGVSAFGAWSFRHACTAKRWVVG